MQIFASAKIFPDPCKRGLNLTQFEQFVAKTNSFQKEKLYLLYCFKLENTRKTFAFKLEERWKQNH